MKIGIIGCPQSGKTTVFNLLSGSNFELHSFSSGKAEAHLGTIKVPDPRLEHLSLTFKPKKTTYTEISFVDSGAMPGGQLSVGFDIAQLKDVDALAHVVGMFAASDPLSLVTTVETELMLVDMEAIQNRTSALKKDIARGKKEEKKEYELLLRCQESLEKEMPLKGMNLTEEEDKLIRGYKFLTLKPMLVVANLSEEQLSSPPTEKLKEMLNARGIKLVEICGKAEMEILELEEKDRKDFLKELGIRESGRDRFIRGCYEALDLVSFFTVVGNEVKAWTVKKGTSALEAAGKIHTDMQRGFIRAEVINYKTFIDCQSSLKEAKSKGLLRLEAKEYIVQDGDIINFKFSV